jgi:beta-lactamase superfamily II metal-dependent hydrolase
VALLVLVAFVAGTCPARGAGTFDIYWVDVEGGAATLMITPQGESVLVDTGNPGRRDAGRIFKVATEVARLRQIDHLVVTHYHRDHFGGASDLAALMPIKNVYDNGEFAGMPEKPDRAYREFTCERRIVINPGDKLDLKQAAGDGKGPLVIQCLATRQKMIEPAVRAAGNDGVCKLHAPKDRDGSDNANSVVLLVSFGDFRFFDAGDLTWNVEHKLVCPQNLVGKVDVYQTTHHGLEASNNPAVLAALEPTVAIMNNGARKGCDGQTVATLRETKSLAAVYQLHKNVRDDQASLNVKDEYIANMAEKCEGHYVKLSVAADGKSYKVSVPANGHEREFKTRGVGR